MELVNLHAAKTHLPRLLEHVAQGEEIVIAKKGHPAAKLVPFPTALCHPGRLKGKIRMAPDFDATLAESIQESIEETLLEIARAESRREEIRTMSEMRGLDLHDPEVMRGAWQA